MDTMNERRGDETAEEMRNEIGKALDKYLMYISDGEAILTGWVAGMDMTSVEMHQSSRSMAIPVVANMQSAAYTRGILDTVKDAF